MTTLTAAAASDLFRRDPDRLIDAEVGSVAHWSVGSGPDVLFVHGWPVSGATFRRLLPHLAEHVTCHVIDLPGAGRSRWSDGDEVSIANHVSSVRRVVDELGLNDVAVVGHDSGGLIARHALAGDHRVRAFGLINTELPGGLSWRFDSFLMSSRLPGFGSILAWAVGKPAVRRNKFVLGDAFADRSLLDGEFDEFFLQPLANDDRVIAAGARLISTFDKRLVDELVDLHRRIEVPVGLVWGDQDPFFPVKHARTAVDQFSDATLTEIAGAGLFSHEEAPEAVAAALLETVR